MKEVSFELTDEVFDLLNKICDEEACTWDEFFTIMTLSFLSLCPFHLDTLKSLFDI